jgi:hypothetical protein
LPSASTIASSVARPRAAVGQLAPDEDARLVRRLEVGGIRDLDVAAQQVEAHLAGEPDLLVEELP